jgi:hypothetical protein
MSGGTKLQSLIIDPAVVTGASTTLQQLAVLCELDASLPFLGRFMSPMLAQSSTELLDILPKPLELMT